MIKAILFCLILFCFSNITVAADDRVITCVHLFSKGTGDFGKDLTVKSTIIISDVLIGGMRFNKETVVNGETTVSISDYRGSAMGPRTNSQFSFYTYESFLNSNPTGYTYSFYESNLKLIEFNHTDVAIFQTQYNCSVDSI